MVLVAAQGLFNVGFGQYFERNGSVYFLYLVGMRFGLSGFGFVCECACLRVGYSDWGFTVVVSGFADLNFEL